MNELFEYIIAAKRNKPGDFGWVVPIVLVIFYAVAAITRARKKTEEEQGPQEKEPPTEEERKASEQWQQKALRKELTHPVQQQRELPASKDRSFDREIPPKGREIAPQRKKVMQEMMEEVYRQATGMPPRQAAKPPSKAVRRPPLHDEPKRPLPVKKPVEARKPRPEETPEPAGKLAGLDRMGEMQRAIVYSEILGKPVALRPDSNLPGLS